jgi:hypothetical protein
VRDKHRDGAEKPQRIEIILTHLIQFRWHIREGRMPAEDRKANALVS